MSTTPGSFFIDYPKPNAIAIGDLIVYEGRWRRILEIDSVSEFHLSAKLEGYEFEVFIDHGVGTARIAGPLLDAFKNGMKDPYR